MSCVIVLSIIREKAHDDVYILHFYSILLTHEYIFYIFQCRKMHYLKGKLMGYFMLEMLTEAVEEIEAILASDHSKKNEKKHLKSFLEFLRSQDEEDKLLFQTTPPAVDKWPAHNTNTFDSIDTRILYRNHAICHTAMLPAQTRYEGILTNKANANSKPNDFDTGTDKFFLKPIEDGQLPLVWDPNDRQKCTALEIDHRDFFYVRTDDEWVSTTIPNSSELNIYGKWGNHLSKREGLIMVCLRTCPFHKCPEGVVGFEQLGRGVLSMKVDDKHVSKVRQLDDCHILEGRQGVRWGADKDQYTVSFRIEQKTGKYLKITSIIFL